MTTSTVTPNPQTIDIRKIMFDANEFNRDKIQNVKISYGRKRIRFFYEGKRIVLNGNKAAFWINQIIKNI